MTAPVRHGVELNAVGEFHCFTRMELTKLVLRLEQPSCLSGIDTRVLVLAGEVDELIRNTSISKGPASLYAVARQRSGIIQGKSSCRLAPDNLSLPDITGAW